MQHASDLFNDSATAYTHLVRKISPQAAGAIKQIRSDFGSHAALRAGLIITRMNMEVDQNHWGPGIGLYTHLIEDYPMRCR